MCKYRKTTKNLKSLLGNVENLRLITRANEFLHFIWLNEEEKESNCW